MASTLKTIFGVNLRATITDTSTGFLPEKLRSVFPFVEQRIIDGTGTNQANKLGLKSFTVSASGSTTVDLATGLLDPKGNAVSLSRAVIVAAFVDENPSTSSWANMIVGGATSTAWESWTTVAGATEWVDPGGIFLRFSPIGFTINSTHKDLKFENPNTNGSIPIFLMAVGS